jgi:aminoglycoside phosphotransferase (APT) family kinase protein
MNPETQISGNQLKQICSLHGLEYRSSTRITVGFSHEVHKLNEDMVIKIYRKDCADKFKTEKAILGSRQDFPKPKLITTSGSNNPIDKDYIIMSFVEGKILGAYWHLATDEQRERIISQLSRILQKINQIDPSTLPAAHDSTWGDT